MRLIDKSLTESIYSKLNEGTFGEEVGFSDEISIDELEENFSLVLCKIFNIPEDKADWFKYNKFELHRGMSWTDSSAWMLVDIESIDAIVESVYKKEPSKYPVTNKLSETDDLVIESGGIEIGQTNGYGQFKNIRTYMTLSIHYAKYDELEEAEAKDLESKLQEEENKLDEEISSIIKEHYDELLNVMLDYEYQDYEEEGEE